jgi:hypothetical protein
MMDSRSDDLRPIPPLDRVDTPKNEQSTSEAPPAGEERRRLPRVQVGSPVTVRILVEEQTFSPFQFEGRCENLSRSGALATVQGLTKDTYRLLIQRPRFVRITTDVPGREQPLVLFGKIVWYNFREDPPTPVCELGVSFESMQEESIAALEQYIRRAANPGDG